MPILATINVSPVGVEILPDVRRLDFEALDGSELLRFSGRAFVMRSGITGLRMAPRRVVTDSYAGLDGERIRHISTGSRNVVIPLFIQSLTQDVQDHLDQLDQLRDYADYRGVDYVSNEGTFNLVATSQDGSVRRLRCAYVDGLEGSEGYDAGGGRYWSSFDVKLLAVKPYWVGDSWSTPFVRLPVSSPFISNNPANGFPRAISATVALGTNMPITVPGKVPSPAIIELKGPATSTHITSPSGLDVTIGSLSAGQTFLLDTGRNRRVLLDGVESWTKLGPSPKWQPLGPGDTTVSVEMAGASSASYARVYGETLWESAW